MQAIRKVDVAEEVALVGVDADEVSVAEAADGDVAARAKARVERLPVHHRRRSQPSPVPSLSISDSTRFEQETDPAHSIDAHEAKRNFQNF